VSWNLPKIVKFDICRVTKGGYIEHLYGRTETWSVFPSVDMLLFGMTIPVTVPQRSEIPEELMNCPVFVKLNISSFNGGHFYSFLCNDIVYSGRSIQPFTRNLGSCRSP
jgi:hypothetical protein